MFSRILIANRGEIAQRIIRACKEMGVETVCVFSEEDRDAAYLGQADHTVCIGPASPSQSYLRGDRIIAAAEIYDVDAIHPGYGFLAENAQFVEQCRDSKIEFIGPSAETIRLLGDKVEARKLAKKAKVPTVPGSDGIIDDDDQAIEIAAKIGYPVMIKAAGGGGGRGIRIAHNEGNLRSTLGQARQESEAAFRNGAVYIEKFVQKPRHVEVQILADHSGHTIHLFERDCSLQRRYQKLIEEAPSPALDDRTRDSLCRAAVRVCKAANYHNAGTVEFLLDQKKDFYFIEVNTRIQVEHPVTEMLTGVDLLKWQLRIAAGEPLTLAQKDIRRSGAVIECRINAEDGHRGFIPSPGTIESFKVPGGFGVRWDSHVGAGSTISPKYDSLIGKLIVHKPTREEAIRCMVRCLEEFEIGPIKTTIPFYSTLCQHARFISSDIDTGFIERQFGI
ncbi:MAG: acetyl-CoA carboxylase biotin carboxylase subunit [Planctomycetes bacterium]|nr:acetyl-CoA carboxylase biotin carboxylase subunit [Planctomycetota bacterium]